MHNFQCFIAKKVSLLSCFLVLGGLLSLSMLPAELQIGSLQEYLDFPEQLQQRRTEQQLQEKRFQNLVETIVDRAMRYPHEKLSPEDKTQLKTFEKLRKTIPYQIEQAAFKKALDYWQKTYEKYPETGLTPEQKLMLPALSLYKQRLAHVQLGISEPMQSLQEVIETNIKLGKFEKRMESADQNIKKVIQILDKSIDRIDRSDKRLNEMREKLNEIVTSTKRTLSETERTTIQATSAQPQNPIITTLETVLTEFSKAYLDAISKGETKLTSQEDALLVKLNQAMQDVNKLPLTEATQKALKTANAMLQVLQAAQYVQAAKIKAKELQKLKESLPAKPETTKPASIELKRVTSTEEMPPQKPTTEQKTFAQQLQEAKSKLKPTQPKAPALDTHQALLKEIRKGTPLRPVKTLPPASAQPTSMIVAGVDIGPLLAERRSAVQGARIEAPSELAPIKKVSGRSAAPLKPKQILTRTAG